MIRELAENISEQRDKRKSIGVSSLRTNVRRLYFVKRLPPTPGEYGIQTVSTI
jgi:hypothetical protein